MRGRWSLGEGIYNRKREMEIGRLSRGVGRGPEEMLKILDLYMERSYYMTHALMGIGSAVLFD